MGDETLIAPFDALERDDDDFKINPVDPPALKFDDPALQAEIAAAAKEAGERMDAIKAERKPAA